MSRHLHIPDILNARDLGGLPRRAGGTTSFRGYIRAANLENLTDEGAQVLHDYSIRTVVDLRCAEELLMTPSRFPEQHTLTVLHRPFLGESMQQWDIRQLDISDGKGYSDMLNKFQPEIAQIMKSIADAPNGGVLFHCYAGKDRTGMVSMLLLSLADVADDVIAEDYALSETGLETMRIKHLGKASDQDRIAAINADFSCSPIYMHAALNNLHGHYGGAASYLHKIGLDENAIERLRQRLAE